MRRLHLVWIGALALGARLLVIASTPGYRPRHDDRSYLLDAVALVRTGAYPLVPAGAHRVPTAYRAPGLPFLLALVDRLGGGRLVDERVALAIVGSTVALLAATLAAELWGAATGVVAGVLTAVSPALVIFDASLISEPLFTAAMLGSLVCAVHARGRGVGWALAAGALGAVAALTRPEGLAVLVGVALCVGGVRRGLAVVAVGVLCIAPWTLRNERALHAFVPISTETGNTLAGAYNPLALRDRRWHDPRLSGIDAAARRAHFGNEAATDVALTGAAERFVVAHPVFPIELAGAGAERITGVAPEAFARRSLQTASLPGRYGALLRAGLLLSAALALVGVLTGVRAPVGWWVAFAVVVAAAVLVNSEDRFAVPVAPFELMLGAFGITRGGAAIRRARTRGLRARAPASR